MTRASFLLLALSSLILPSCKSVSLGGSGEDGGADTGGGTTLGGCDSQPKGTPKCAYGEPTVTCVDGKWSVKCPDAPSGGQGGGGAGGTGGTGGTSGSGTCAPRTFDVDCYGSSAVYTCVQRGGEWVWEYSCSDTVADAGPRNVDAPPAEQHPYVSTGAACMDYPTSGYRWFPEDPSVQDTNHGESWPRCTPNCNTPKPVSGAYLMAPLNQALPAGSCDDEGATCGLGANAWCGPCANVGGPYNFYTCVCRAHTWHCAESPIKGANVCGMPTCFDPSLDLKPNSDCAKTTWTDTQVCACGICRDLCDSDAQCPSGRCKLNQVCRSTQNCQGPGECWAPCYGLCEPVADGGVVDGGSVQPVDAAPGCDPAKAAQAATAAGLSIVGEGATVNENLPASLSSGPNWGVKDIECREGGYDLSPVAGKSVCLVSFSTTALCQQLPATAWVVMSEGIVRCIYQSADLNPGIYSVHDSSCTSPDAGAASCPGANPALRTCRNTASECIPSACNCGSPGSPNTWRCTTDCRSLPLCAADAGTTCSGARIDSQEAASAFSEYIRLANPEVKPTGTYRAEEQTVVNLWETLRAQLFFATWYADDGTAGNTTTFLYRDCTITTLSDNSGFVRIDSGVVTNGAFYYSWGSGSGIYRSNLGKVALDGTTLIRATSPSYFNPSSGPPGLVVTLENARLVVYRAAVAWGKFNEWTNPEPIGFLKDYGDRLAVVDDTGKELSTTLP